MTVTRAQAKQSRYATRSQTRAGNAKLALPLHGDPIKTAKKRNKKSLPLEYEQSSPAPTDTIFVGHPDDNSEMPLPNPEAPLAPTFDEIQDVTPAQSASGVVDDESNKCLPRPAIEDVFLQNDYSASTSDDDLESRAGTSQSEFDVRYDPDFSPPLIDHGTLDLSTMDSSFPTAGRVPTPEAVCDFESSDAYSGTHNDTALSNLDDVANEAEMQIDGPAMPMANGSFTFGHDEPEPLNFSARIDSSFAHPDDEPPKSSPTLNMEGLDISAEFKCQMERILDN